MSTRKTLLAAVVFLALLIVYLLDTQRMARREQLKERSERLIAFDADQIQRAALHNPNGDFLLEQVKGEGWKLLKPIHTRADTDQVVPMLQNIAGAKKRNVFTPEGDLAQYGLKDPKVWIEIAGIESGKPRTVKILFGDTAAQTYQVYGRIDGGNDLFTLSDYSMKQCEKDLFQLRDKTIVAAAPETIRELDITAAGRSIQLKRKPAPANAWTLDPPGANADPTAVDNLLRTLRNTKATKIFDDATTPAAALDLTPEAARAIVRVVSGSAEQTNASTAPATGTVTLLLGKKPPDGDGLYCRIENDPRLFVVRETLLGDLSKDPRELRDRKILEVADADVAALIIRAPAKSVEVTRTAKDAPWAFAPAETRKVSQQKVNRLLADVTALHAKEFLADAGGTTTLKLPEWGLTEPSLELRVKTFDSTTTHGFDVGDTNTDSGIVYVRRLSDGAVVGLDFKRLSDFHKFHEEIEDRTFVQFNTPDVSQLRIELQGPQGAVTYDFTKRKSSWAAQTSAGRKVTVQPFDVQQFLQELTELEYADPYAPEAGDATRGGLASPTVRITALDASGKELAQLSIGERKGFRRVMGTPAAEYVVDLTNTDRVSRGLYTLLSRVEQAPPEGLLGEQTPAPAPGPAGE